MDDKIKVLIASVLKPADDVRSCFKIGQSLAQTNKYEVNIIGFDSKKKAPSQNIFLYPLFKFKRNSWKRLFAPFKVLQIFLKLNPKLIIVNTPELLWVMILIKILFGTKIIYDIRENYRLNIRYNKVYRGFIKLVAQLYIRLNENLSKYFLEGYFIAEDVYEQQLHFLHQKPFIKLLNKTVLPITNTSNNTTLPQKRSLRLIYTGTIGKEYGTMDAVEFCKALFNNNDKITLIIIGYSPDYKYLNKLKACINNERWIKLISEDKPISQPEIIDELNRSDIALLPYELNPNISSRFPTKIYDLLALSIPMVIPPQKTWKAILDEYPAALCVDFKNPDIGKFLKEVDATNFYLKKPTQEIQWKSQETILLKFVEKILSK